MKPVVFAWLQLRSAWRSGEMRVLLASLVLAVAAMSAVGFFADRIQSALARQGGLLLGADMLVVSDHPLSQPWVEQARIRGLKAVQVLEFPSMVLHRDAGHLAEVKAVADGYPLRGQLAVSEVAYGPARVARRVPTSGEVWLEPRLATVLGVQVGGRISLGEREFVVGAILSQEPSRGGDLFSIAPRLMMALSDVPSTGLVQYGSRISYRLLVAGEDSAVRDYAGWANAHLERGIRVEDVRSARPEVRSALDKTRQFLGLAATASVILAMVAMALAMLRHVQRHLDTCALMRCFGASQHTIVAVFLWQTLMLGFFGGAVGCMFGYASQEVLAQFAGSLFLEKLPAPTWMPAISGMMAGMAALLGIMLPHLLHLRGVPALRILRRDLGGSVVHRLAYVPALAVLLGLVFWNARDIKLGWIVLAGLSVLLIVAALAAWLSGRMLHGTLARAGGAWRLGLANLLRRPGAAIAQVAGFSLGLMAMLLLTLVRGDLLASWQSSLPPDAPNRFVINIQPKQLQPVQEFFAEAGQPPPQVFPMVRGRLVAINGAALDPNRYADDRARRLASREFNLSWASHMQEDNRIVAGRWWRSNEHGEHLLSMEQGIAQALGIGVGDKLTYDIAGNRVELKIQSLRKVEWDSMRANFFAVTPPGVLDGYSANYITSIHLAAEQEGLLNRLVQRFPNVTVIDVAAILQQVRGIMDRMAYAVQFVFGFCLLSGFAVLYAALSASLAERKQEAALLRVLGASRRQVLAGVLAEFAWVGLLAGAIATAGASVLAWAISTQLLNLPYAFNPWLALTALSTGGLLVPCAAWLGLRGVMRQPPRQALQSV
jgi:putative ABC transport system permease protein